MVQNEMRSEMNVVAKPPPMPVGIYTCDALGRINFFNEAAAELWGCKPKLSEDVRDFCAQYKTWQGNGREWDITDPLILTLSTGESLHSMPVMIERKDGSRVRAYLNIDPIIDAENNITGAISMFYDISALQTDQRFIDQESSYTLQLKQSEERYHKMIEEVEDYAIILLDREGNIKNWNKGAEKIKGYSEAEIVHKNFRIFYTEADRKRKIPESLIHQAKISGKAVHEGWRLRKDGSKFWGSIVLTAIHDDLNNVIGFSKVTRDLTERKLAEDKLKEYNAQLEFQNLELEQFAYAASHDMKEPLRKINFFLSTLLDDKELQLSDKVRDYLKRSIHSTKRMTSLIHDLLTYSQVSSKEENFEQVDLKGLVDEIGNYHKEELERKVMRIDVGPLPVIEAVPFQMKQLFDNLINNSIKYKHPDRDVHVMVNSDIISGADINLPGVEMQQLYHRLSIVDNGIGFSQEYADKIFELFQRLYAGGDTKGSGIGLSICKKIVQNHKGFITGSGVDNEGARFDIYLPIVNAQ